MKEHTQSKFIKVFISLYQQQSILIFYHL